jgi:hypothetical protein
MKRIALIFVTLHLLFACSLNYHLGKAIKKGYRCDTINDTIKITSVDSFPVIVHDSIVWEKVFIQKDTIVRYNTSYVPKTRYQYRMDTKRFNDSLKAVKKMYNDSLEAEIKMHSDKLDSDVKIEKQITKREKKSNLFLLGLLTGIILTLIIKYAINQALKKFTRINL